LFQETLEARGAAELGTHEYVADLTCVFEEDPRCFIDVGTGRELEAEVFRECVGNFGGVAG
jgi:hypothetical protein